MDIFVLLIPRLENTTGAWWDESLLTVEVFTTAPAPLSLLWSHRRWKLVICGLKCFRGEWINERNDIYEMNHILNCGCEISIKIANLVRALHRHREVTGSNPVEVLNFSGLAIAKIAFITAEIKALHSSFIGPNQGERLKKGKVKRWQIAFTSRGSPLHQEEVYLTWGRRSNVMLQCNPGGHIPLPFANGDCPDGV